MLPSRELSIINIRLSMADEGSQLNPTTSIVSMRMNSSTRTVKNSVENCFLIDVPTSSAQRWQQFCIRIGASGRIKRSLFAFPDIFFGQMPLTIKQGAQQRRVAWHPGLHFFFECSDAHRNLHSFPTRRSSD